MKSKRRFMHGRRRRRSPLLQSDTLEVTLADSVYKKDKVNKTLVEKGFDPNTRTNIPGTYGVHNRTIVKKIDPTMDDDSIVGSQVRLPPEDYL